MESELRVMVDAPNPADIEAFGAELINALRVTSPELAAELERRVRARTPKRTGALREAISSKAYTSLVKGKRAVSLVNLYAESEPQLSEWGRIYWWYQEYLPLGKSTYTPNRAQMFYKVETEDTPYIEEWANDTVNAYIENNLPGGTP